MGKKLTTRIEFTTAIGKLSFVKLLDAKEQGRLFAKFTNLVYLNLQDVEMTAQEFKTRHGVAQRQIAKHYFRKDGLLDLEKIESKLAIIIEFSKPVSECDLDNLFEQFFSSLGE